MSYVNRRGKDASWRNMVVRQQVSDILSYDRIITTKSRAKLTQKCLEQIITLSKTDSLSNKREVASVVLGTTKYTKEKLLKKIFTEVSARYKDRQGGYSRLLKMKEENRVVLSLV